MYRLILIIFLMTMSFSACDDDSTSSNNNTNNNNNSTNNSNNTNNNIINNTNMTCEDPMDVKEIHWANFKIYHGDTDAAMCMTPAQKMAVGAILSADADWANVCSATLVSDVHVITAAHCASHYNGEPLPANQLRFALGDDASNPDGVFNVQSVHVNPDYSFWSTTTGTDHAILVLSTSPLDTLDVEPIPVNFADISNLKGRYVQQVGFGTTEDDDNNSMKWWTPEMVSNFSNGDGDMIVNGQGESSVCSGDSGGPSLYPMDGNIVSVIGTVSWGDASCVDNDHYAMTNWDEEWISDYLPEYDYCGDLDEAGTCDGNIARWCENGLPRTECCDEVTGPCGENTEGKFRCSSPKNACSTELSWDGKCSSNGVIWCWFGKLHYRNCEVCGTTCGDTGVKGIGKYCIE